MTHVSKKLFDIIGGRHFQIIALIATGVYVAVLLALLNDAYSANESIVPVTPISKRMEQFATKVTVGMHIDNFPLFSFDKNEFVIDAVVWFRFPVGTECLETIENFTIDNTYLQQSGSLMYKSQPNIKLIDNDVVIAFDVQTTFKAPLNYQKFPIGDHKLNIIVNNKYVSPYELIFEADSDSLTFSDHLMITNWKQCQTYVRTGYKQELLHKQDNRLEQSYPIVVFSIDFENIGYQELMSLYFPMFVIFFIGLVSLVINIREARERLAFIGQSVPILVLFRMVIDSVSPPGVGYNTHVDKVFYLLVFISLLILLFQAYVTVNTRHLDMATVEKRELVVQRLIRENSIVLLISLSTVILFMTYNALLFF